MGELSPQQFLSGLLSKAAQRDATAKRFSGLRHVFTDPPAFLFILWLSRKPSVSHAGVSERRPKRPRV